MNTSSTNKPMLIRPTLLAYYIMIAVTIFNKNQYHASIAFILYPVVLVYGLCFIKLQFSLEKMQNYLVTILICFSTIISTILSDVVEWGSAASSFFIFIVLYILITIRDYNANDIKNILKFYAYITLVLALWLLVNIFLSYNLVNGRVSLTILGVRKDENYLSSYIVFGFFYFFTSFLFGSKKKKYLIYSGIIFIAIFMTGSRGALVAMLSCFSFIIVKYIFMSGINGRSIMISFAIVILILAVYLGLSGSALFSRMSDVDGYTENIRLTIWGYAIEGFLRRPWIGSGIQSGTYFAQQHVRWYTHSCFVDLITSVGILGAILYGWQYIVYCTVRRENILFIVSMLLILFVPLMFINGFETATFWMPMALCKITSDYCKQNTFCNLLL
ncbi:MAG: O-antigen ligase family protein [Lachnospiraceae bacterium]|nr:O-antigen ligase family protein [Lachnospiraceae bacterium]